MLNLAHRYATQTMKKLDPAVVKLLGLDTATATVTSAGGGGCSSASTSKIVSKRQDGTENAFFMKTGSGKDAKVMFAGRSMGVRAAKMTR
jgi:protein-ribulosamine 3-kinase